MRTRLHTLTALPLLILGVACADEHITSPGDALFAKPGGATSASHEIVTLGALAGHSANWAVGITDLNVVAGASWDSGRFPNRSSKVFRWSDGVLDDLGYGLPHGINNAGAIVGWTYEEHTTEWPLFVLQDGSRTQLEAGLGTYWRAYDMINDAGTVIGHRGTIGDDGRLWTAGSGVWTGPSSYGEQPASLGFPAWCTEDESYDCESPNPYAINNEGTIAGDIGVTYRYPDGTSVFYKLATVWSAGEYDSPAWLQRGPSGFTYRWAYGINDAGWIVGAVGTFRAAVWIPDASGKHGAAVELPHAGTGRAYAASEPDENGIVQIVGDADGKAVLWLVSPSGGVTGPVNLGTPDGYATSAARAVNTNGWIVGNGETTTGKAGGSVAVIWRPLQDNGNGGTPCTHPKGKCR